MQHKVFSLNLAIKYVRLSYIRVQSAKPAHTKPDRPELDHAESNQGLHCQTSCEICALLEYYQHFRTIYQSHLQTTRNPKEIPKHDFSYLASSFLWDFVHHLPIKRCTKFWKLGMFPFSCKEAYNLVYPID